jgi:hypothetical protein
MCDCKHHSPIECDAIRFDFREDDTNLIELLTDNVGCTCRCHRSASGAEVSLSVWQARSSLPVPVKRRTNVRSINCPGSGQRAARR